jgi:hypothetical protein
MQFSTAYFYVFPLRCKYVPQQLLILETLRTSELRCDPSKVIDLSREGAWFSATYTNTKRMIFNAYDMECIRETMSAHKEGFD